MVVDVADMTADPKKSRIRGEILLRDDNILRGTSDASGKGAQVGDRC